MVCLENCLFFVLEKINKISGETLCMHASFFYFITRPSLICWYIPMGPYNRPSGREATDCTCAIFPSRRKNITFSGSFVHLQPVAGRGEQFRKPNDSPVCVPDKIMFLILTTPGPT